MHSIFHAKVKKSVFIKKLVLDARNPWAMSQQFSLYEQLSAVVNGGDTDL